MLDEAGAPVTVTLYGPGSPEYAKAAAARENRMVDRLRRRGKSDVTPEENARERAAFLAGCTKEFSANVEREGLAGEKLFKAIYGDSEIGFIADQVAKHLADWGNFTTGSSKP